MPVAYREPRRPAESDADFEKRNEQYEEERRKHAQQLLDARAYVKKRLGQA